jgi:hypothetical protein
MAIRVQSMRFTPILVLVSTFACARVNVQSQKRQDYDKKLDRTLIAFTGMEKFGRDYQKMLRERIIAEFGKRGVVAVFATTPDRLALDEAPSFDAQAKQSSASTALIVYRTGGTVDALSGQILNAQFDAQLFDLAAHKRVWRASIGYGAGGGFSNDSDRVDKLVGGIANALASDGLLAAAPSGETSGAEAQERATERGKSDLAAGASAAATPAAAGFPHVLAGSEIAAHFARYATIEASQGRQQFTVYLHADNRVERLCPGCRVPSGDGRMDIEAERGVVCFRWRVTYPDSGCYQVVQTAADRYLLRGVDRERPINYWPGTGR